MYRYITAASLASMFDEFDLDDFSEITTGRLHRLLERLEVPSDVQLDSISIKTHDSNEYLDFAITINNKPYEVSYLLDRRYIRRPRDLITNYSERVVHEFLSQLQDEVFAASYSMEQEFTSKQTASGNGRYNKGQGRVPALFKKISWRPNTVNFDYGCGEKSTQNQITNYLEQRGVQYIGFDKYHQTAEEKQAAWDAVDDAGGADTCTCANVLNVIKEHDVRVNEVIANIYEALKPGGVAYFDVYESDRSSVGGQTGKDNYQLKRPIDGYVEEVAEIFGENNVKLRGKVIEARK